MLGRETVTDDEPTRSRTTGRRRRGRRDAGGRLAGPGRDPGRAASSMLLAESGGEPVGPSELARRLGPARSPRSRTSAARWPMPGSSGGSGPGSRWAGASPSSAGPISRRVDQVQEFYEASRQPAGRLRGDRPVRGPRRPRGHLPRPPRRPPAGPADVGHRPPAAGLLDRDRQGRARLAPRGRARRAGWPGLTTLPRATRKAHAHGRRAAAPTSTRSGERGYAIDDEQTMEGVVCYGVMVPSRQPGGEGPCAASITLLKVRATAERVPALIADLHWLAAELSDPSGATDTAGTHARPLRRRRPRAPPPTGRR